MKLSIMQWAIVGLLGISVVIYAASAFSPANKNADNNATPTPTVTSTPVVTSIMATVVVPTISDADALRLAVLAKSQIPVAEFNYSLGSNNGVIARGSVKNNNDYSGAAWFAGKVNGVWKVSYIGQGVPACADIAGINYPTTWISHCMNGSTTVQR
jgi:hypothetical protein